MHAPAAIIPASFALSMTLVAAPVTAAELVPVSQFRFVVADSIISPPAAQDIHSLSAPDFGVFDEPVRSFIVNDNASSETNASQQSSIDGCSISGTGSAVAGSQASAEGFHGYSISHSSCRVTVDLDQQAECLIAGTLQVDGTAQAQVTLQAFPAQPLFSRMIASGSLGVHQRMTLSPGRYIITFDALATTAANDKGALAATADFDLRFTLCFNPADIDGDGAVNVSDLVAVILAWGECPAPPEACAADINLDGAVNVNDLVAVILAWGT